jgi:hypothetical protein
MTKPSMGGGQNEFLKQGVKGSTVSCNEPLDSLERGKEGGRQERKFLTE